MATQPHCRLTPEEYLELDRASDVRHEYRCGEVYAMAGGSPAHSFIGNNLSAALTFFARNKKFLVFNSDLRVCANRPDLWCYRGDKTFACRQCASMREILLEEPLRVHVEHFWKLPNVQWELETVTDSSATLTLVSLGCELPVGDIYRDAELFRET